MRTALGSFQFKHFSLLVMTSLIGLSIDASANVIDHTWTCPDRVYDGVAWGKKFDAESSIRDYGATLTLTRLSHVGNTDFPRDNTNYRLSCIYGRGGSVHIRFKADHCSYRYRQQYPRRFWRVFPETTPYPPVPSDDGLSGDWYVYDQPSVRSYCRVDESDSSGYHCELNCRER